MNGNRASRLITAILVVIVIAVVAAVIFGPAVPQ